jgi:hypothetical protein
MAIQLPFVEIIIEDLEFVLFVVVVGFDSAEKHHQCQLAVKN